MPRTARASVGGMCYHVLNRGNGQAKVFHKDADYAAFLDLMVEANERLRLRVLGYVLMPNHFHLVLWPRGDGDLSRWMQWLMTSHVRRYHRHYHGSGHVWQGRFKAFPIQQDEHLLAVLHPGLITVTSAISPRAVAHAVAVGGVGNRLHHPHRAVTPGKADRPDHHKRRHDGHYPHPWSRHQPLSCHR